MELLLLILLTLLFSAFFSGTEIAFLSSDRLRFQLDKSKGGIAAQILSRFFDKPDRFVTTLLLGNNIALVIYGLLMGQLLDPLLHRYFSGDAMNLLLQSLIGTIFILLMGEFLPKIAFRNNPNQILSFCAPLLGVIYLLLYPIVFLITMVSNFILFLLGQSKKKGVLQPSLSTADLEHYINQNKGEEGSGGSLETEVKMMQNAIEFSSLQVRDCMLPRNEIYAIDISTEAAVLEELFIKSGHSKLVVYDQSIDNAVGYIHVSELFRDEAWQKRIVAPLYVPESMNASKLMKSLMAKKKSMAIVIDEMGGTAGLVTLEDLVEEIFGDIEDEHDKRQRVARQIDENTYILSGRMEIDDVNERFGLSLPENDEYMTIAGLILHYHPSIPSSGEEIDIEGWCFEIIRSTSTRIVLVKLKRKEIG